MPNGSTMIFTIFGGTGDLTNRKLLPAFYNLLELGKLAHDFKIVVIGRRLYTTNQYLQLGLPWLQKFTRLPFKQETFEQLATHITYLEMDFENIEDYNKLEALYQQWPGQHQRLYYLAVAPQYFSTISQHLKKHGLIEPAHLHQVIIEKPFGHDIASAQLLHEDLVNTFGENDIYRIDHYLGKEMIQNILSIRFHNTLFEGIWNKQQIDNIQISALETVGVENRGNYYDHTGAIKDMVQNHLLQILTMVTMERPDDFSAENIRKAQVDILDSLRFPIEGNLENHMIVGQYQQGEIDNVEVKGYQQEDKISPNSATETFVALKICIDNDRWQGVPIYLRTGKRCARRATEVVIQFKAQPKGKSNLLIIRIYPDEGVYLRFNAKKPGTTQEIVPVFMDFCQSCVYENRINTPEAYERLIEAAINQDQSLFTGWQQVQKSWRFIDTLLAIKNKFPLPLHPYTSGQSGPEASDTLLALHQHQWIEEESKVVEM